MRPFSRLFLATASVLAVAATQAAADPLGIKLTPLGSYREETAPGSGVCRKGIAQIGAYDFLSRLLFVTNSADNALDILNIGNPAHPTLVKRVLVSDLTGSANFEPPGVAAAFGLVALAVKAIDPVSANGKLLLLDHDGKLLREFEVGSGPERVAFSPNGQFIVVAVQGEKDEANAIDPKGGIAIIDLGHGIQQAKVRVRRLLRVQLQRHWSRVAFGSARIRATPTSWSRRYWTSSPTPSPSRPIPGLPSSRCS